MVRALFRSLREACVACFPTNPTTFRRFGFHRPVGPVFRLLQSRHPIVGISHHLPRIERQHEGTSPLLRSFHKVTAMLQRFPQVSSMMKSAPRVDHIGPVDPTSVLWTKGVMGSGLLSPTCGPPGTIARSPELVSELSEGVLQKYSHNVVPLWCVE